MHATAYSHIIIKSHTPLIEPSQVQEWHTEALRQCMAHSLHFHSSLFVQFCWCQPCLTSGLCRFGHALQSSAGHGTRELLQDRCSAREPGVWQDWAGFEHHNLFQFWGFSMLFFFGGVMESYDIQLWCTNCQIANQMSLQCIMQTSITELTWTNGTWQTCWWPSNKCDQNWWSRFAGHHL